MGARIYHFDEQPTCDAHIIASHVPVVLVVDDEKAMLAMVQDVLEDDGFCVLTANGGKQALKLVSEACPDLIITDLMMPKMSGRMLRDILSSTPSTSDIPIILMTAAYHPEANDQFQAIVAKPFHIDEFLECVHRCATQEPPTS